MQLSTYHNTKEIFDFIFNFKSHIVIVTIRKNEFKTHTYKTQSGEELRLNDQEVVNNHLLFNYQVSYFIKRITNKATVS